MNFIKCFNFNLEYVLIFVFFGMGFAIGLCREPLLMPCSRWKNTEVQCRGSSPNVQHSVIIPGSDESRFPELAYDRLQLNDGELLKGIKHRSFGRYVAREAMIDEEYWV